MCYNYRWIKNPYNAQLYYVRCGHCVPCLQEKANKRVERIKNEYLSAPSSCGLVCIFLMLHYDNNHVPYVRRSDFEYFKEDPDNRDLFIYRNGKTIDCYEKKDFWNRGHVSYPDFSNLSFGDNRITSYRGGFHYLKDLVSVHYHKDIQNFFKLLKINLFRNDYKGYFSYFYTSDYGGEYQRCHYHALIFCDVRYYQDMVNTIIKSWKYSDLSKPRRQKDGSIKFSWEIARNPANYVASYVNSVEDLPSALRLSKPFRPRYKFSQGFGCHYREFSLDSILRKIERGDLYFVERRVSKGSVVDRSVLLPNYVLSRYFPKFKGFGSLLPDEIIQLAIQPSRIFAHARFKEVNIDLDDFIPCSSHGLTFLDLTLDQCKCIYTKLLHINRRCYDLGYQVFIDWAFAYSRVWSLYSSLCLKESWKNATDFDVPTHYDNIDEYMAGRVRSIFLDENYLPLIRRIGDLDPNKFNRNIIKNAWLNTHFHFQKHHHQVKSYYYE